MNGCNGRAPFKDVMHVQDGWLTHAVQRGDQIALERTPKIVEVPFRMSMDCQYTQDDMVGSKDKDCVGCPWRVSNG